MKKLLVGLVILSSASAFAGVEVKCTRNAQNPSEAIDKLNVLILPALGKVKSASAVTIIEGSFGKGFVQACITIVKD